MRPKTKSVNFMLLDGGVGDQIAALTPIAYTIKHYPWVTPLCWVPDYLVDFAKNVLPEGTYIKGLSSLRYSYNPNKPTKTTKWDGHTSSMKVHVMDYAFLRLLDENPDIQHKNYLKVDFSQVPPKDLNLPDKYAVFTTGFTAEVREWLPTEVNKTARWCVDNGITPVFLGQTQTATGTKHQIKGTFKEEIDFSLGISLIDKTTLLEAAAIMQHSKAVLGVDNGLLHLAGCTDAEIIAGYTTVNPNIRAPIRHNTLTYNFTAITPPATLDCRFCQQTTNFLYGHDYRFCYQKQADKKLKCLNAMAAENFIEILEQLCES